MGTLAQFKMCRLFAPNRPWFAGRPRVANHNLINKPDNRGLPATADPAYSYCAGIVPMSSCFTKSGLALVLSASHGLG
jgi:hypothetical protein